jgi:hypothetical protein
VQIQDEHSKRLKLETQFIKSTADLLYNPEETIHYFQRQPRVAQRVKIDDSIYCIAEAAQIGKSSRTLRLRLDDPSQKQYQRLVIVIAILMNMQSVSMDIILNPRVQLLNDQTQHKLGTDVDPVNGKNGYL